ncbi:AAA family ATPase [candidate division KSB1 bacterium]|nr:AAA family ATPase [candidate division KSB1 bacterium]
MHDLYYQYNPWWEGSSPLDDLKPREKYLQELRRYLEFKHIIILAGLRRVGKTSLMKLIINELLTQNVEPHHIFYISLDDYMIQKATLFDLLSEYRQLHKIKVEEKIYLFFDEVTYKDNFHIQLKNIYDSQNAKTFVASSSASKLRDKKASLTGRSITINIKPLDLYEYLFFKNIEIKKSDSQLYRAYFLDYIQSGGLPENVLNPSREYLMSLGDIVNSCGSKKA